MHARKICSYLILLIVCLLGASSLFAAQPPDGFIKAGISAYENNQYRDAIDSFCEVLLLDPHHSQARNYLKLMTSQTELPSFVRIELLALLDALAQVDKYIKLDHSMPAFSFENFPRSISGPLERLQFVLKEQRQALPQNETSPTIVKKKIPQKVNAVPLTATDLKSEKFSIEAQILKEGTGNAILVQASTLGAKLKKLSETLSLLKNIVQEKEIKILEQVHIINRLKYNLEGKDQEIARLNREVNDFESRIELGQALMTKKDKMIFVLKSENVELREITKDQNSEYETTLFSKDEKLIEMHGILQIYKAKLTDATKELHQKDNALSKNNDHYDQGIIREAVQNFKKVQNDLDQLSSRIEQLKQENSNETDVLSVGLQKEVDSISIQLERVRAFLDANTMTWNKAPFVIPFVDIVEIQEILYENQM